MPQTTFNSDQVVPHVVHGGDDAPVGKCPTLTHFGRPNRSVPYLDDDPPPETLGNIIRDELAHLGLKLSKCDAAPHVAPAGIPKWLRRGGTAGQNQVLAAENKCLTDRQIPVCFDKVKTVASPKQLAAQLLDKDGFLPSRNLGSAVTETKAAGLNAMIKTTFNNGLIIPASVRNHGDIPIAGPACWHNPPASRQAHTGQIPHYLRAGYRTVPQRISGFIRGLLGRQR